jgi:protein O-mannosyl-transferase
LWSDLALPILLPILAYVNSLGGDFVHDDIPAIVRNPAVSGGGGDGNSLSRLLTVDFWGDRLTDAGSHKSFRPLTTATFRLTAALAGLKSPLAFHSVNILLHAAVSAGLYVVSMRRLGLRQPTARLAAVLFALHPVHTEAVAGIVGRADLLAGLFMLASFYVVTGGGTNNDRWPDKGVGGGGSKAAAASRTCISYLLAILALLSKEIGITVLGINLVFQLLVNSSYDRQRCALLTQTPPPTPSSSPRRRNESSRCNSCCRNCNGSVRSNSNNNNISSQQPTQHASRPLYLLLRPILLHSLLAASILVARIAQNGDVAPTPSFSAADNPAGFLTVTSSSNNSSGIRAAAPRILTHLYLAAFHVEQLLWPAVLSYDWQMGAVPLVTSLADGRNLETAALFLLLGRLFVAAAATAERRRSPAVIFGLLFLVLPFIPASNLFFRVGFVAAEREGMRMEAL